MWCEHLEHREHQSRLSMIQHQYSLAKRGKWICPQCGKKTFVCYVDENNQVLDEGVGKCDRADHCAYHYPPRDYFADHQVIAEVKPRRHRPMLRPLPPPSYIDPDVFKRSVLATESHRNHLVTFLNSVFNEAIVGRMVHDYYIGTSKHWEGSTVFWQLDRYGHVHGGKIMQYNPTNGKRVKEPFNHITWVHTAMGLTDYNLKQCLFGEHLLRDYPDMTVAVVESEKTAIIASGVFGDCITVACGGCGNLTNALCEPLRGRDVVLFPDNGKLAEWSEKGSKMRHLFGRLFIADIMEREAMNVGDDIGDLIVQRYPEWQRQSLDIIPINLGLTEL